jgi:hypothetical protein
MERHVCALNYNIAGQAAEAHPREERPQESCCQDYQAGHDKKTLYVHRTTLLHGAMIRDKKAEQRQGLP